MRQLVQEMREPAEQHWVWLLVLSTEEELVGEAIAEWLKLKLQQASLQEEEQCSWKEQGEREQRRWRESPCRSWALRRERERLESQTRRVCFLPVLLLLLAPQKPPW
jgi:hypothetical protein